MEKQKVIPKEVSQEVCYKGSRHAGEFALDVTGVLGRYFPRMKVEHPNDYDIPYFGAKSTDELEEEINFSELTVSNILEIAKSKKVKLQPEKFWESQSGGGYSLGTDDGSRLDPVSEQITFVDKTTDADVRISVGKYQKRFLRNGFGLPRQVYISISPATPENKQLLSSVVRDLKALQ